MLLIQNTFKNDLFVCITWNKDNYNDINMKHPDNLRFYAVSYNYWDQKF